MQHLKMQQIQEIGITELKGNTTQSGYIARMYLQLPLRQWNASNVYLLVLSSWNINIAENSIAVMGL